MQEAAIREWPLLTADERSNLRTYCLHYVMARADAREAYIHMKVLSVAVVLLKRGWLESVATEKKTFFAEVRQAVLGALGPAAQQSGNATGLSTNTTSVKNGHAMSTLFFTY